MPQDRRTAGRHQFPPANAVATSHLRLALYQPDIPQNTGTILRLAACLGVGVDVIGPTGFDLTDRALKRAGLDYLAHVEIARHVSFDAFETARRRHTGQRLVLLTTAAAEPHLSFAFRNDDILLLGRESAGVPAAVHAAADARSASPCARLALAQRGDGRSDRCWRSLAADRRLVRPGPALEAR